MKRFPVTSSRIKSVGWEGDVLEIKFHSGEIYNYFRVSYIEFQNFINAPSLGSALTKLDKVHSYKKLT